MRWTPAASLILIGIVCSANGQSTTAEPPKKDAYFYNATTSLLRLTRGLPMTVSIHQVNKDESNVYSFGKMLANADFPEASKATVENTKTELTGFTKFSFSLSSSNAVEGNNLDLTSMKLDFEMFHDHRTGYWNVSAMTVAVVGKMKGNCSDVGCDVNLTNNINVAPRRGYTDSPVDVNCQRNYTTCAPVNLCWTCYDHKVSGFISQDGSAKTVLAILIPGMQLQPLATNGTTNFGYRWDCDPIWSSALWFSLLLGLFLIAILAWAIEMLVTLQTPSKFDDPKGKPLVVPLTD